MKNDKAVIWGTGSNGERAFHKVSHIWDIVGFCDNNCDKWNQKFMGLNIYAPNDLLEISNCDIVIASLSYEDIIEQILEMGVEAERIFYINPMASLVQNVKGEELFCRERKKMHILFVQSTPLIRIDKIACVLKNNGICSDVAYLSAPPELCVGMERNPYEKVISINDLREFVQYVDEADYDLVWSANMPDCLTTLLLSSNKRIIHDINDMASMWVECNIDQMVHEFVANRQSHANVYVTDEIKQIAEKKFGLEKKEVLILNNYVLKADKPKRFLKKRSSIDGEIHCVYEGGIWPGKRTLRYYEDIFQAIARQHIHVHFYSGNNEYVKSLGELDPYLHYEGCLSYEELMTELTQYDVGLVTLNITQRNNLFLQTTFPNKIFEYLFAGLPVAVANIKSMIQFVNEYKVGQYLDLNGDIGEQIQNISKIKIDNNFLENNKLTMDDQAEKIIAFFERIIRNTL